jgi:hypothetical protein
MGRFDAEKAQAVALAKQYEQFMPMVKANSEASTAALREFLGKVQKHESRLEDIAKTAADRLRYLDQVEKSIVMLEGLLQKAKSLNETDAAKILAAKSWGNLLDYDYNKAQPAKPQLVKSVEGGIESEIKRGKFIVDEQRKSAEAWTKSAQKHVDYCKKATAAMAGAVF